MNIDQNNLTDLSTGEFEITPERLLANPSVTQHTVRTVESGIDQIAAYFRVEFLPDEKRKILHIPIHPAMATPPDVQAMGVEQDVRIRITDCQKFGIRIEAVLASPPSKLTKALVEVIISSEFTE